MALGGMQQVASHQAAGAAVEGRNRAKLRNYQRQNQEYDHNVLFDTVDHNNDVQLAGIDQDQVYMAMIDQWSEQDQKLDKLFAQGDHEIEDAIVEMHQNSYAGTLTGATAARLAGASAKELGRKKARVLSERMFAKEETSEAKRRISAKADVSQRKIYEDVRFAPIHGLRPAAPELEAKPSSAGLILGLAGVGLEGWKTHKEFKATNIGKATDEAVG